MAGLAGKGLRVKEGTHAKMGTLALNGATAVTVATTVVTATSRVFPTVQAAGGTPTGHRVRVGPYGRNVVQRQGSCGDTSTVAWLIVELA
ncbi:hypothetical protein [Streptomyces mirabilis]|uniref:hypothetical protein n=1 Tax=Streptomyces mirabilis TaxID=68239 RepID=UPI0036A70154